MLDYGWLASWLGFTTFPRAKQRTTVENANRRTENREKCSFIEENWNERLACDSLAIALYVSLSLLPTLDLGASVANSEHRAEPNANKPNRGKGVSKAKSPASDTPILIRTY